MAALPFDGLAVGGSLGRDRAEMLTMLQLLLPKLRVAGGETIGRRFTQPLPTQSNYHHFAQLQC